MLATTPLPTTVLDAARAVSVPREPLANSFVLHAPLELMARVGLLPYLDADGRDAAVARIAKLAADYNATGPAAPRPAVREFGACAEAAGALRAAIEASDLDEVEAVMSWLAVHANPMQLRHLLGEAIVDSLAAAAHTPIGLYLLPRVGDGQLPASLLRAPVRELARAPEWRLDWFRDRTHDDADHANDAPTDLESALRAIPHLGTPGSDFIYPLMSQAEQSGVAPRFLGPLLDTDVTTATRTLLRAAAWSMLHDDQHHAPYGWSHCLTMPQAVLALAGDGVEPRTALAVAATYVVGFRAAHGSETLGPLGDDDADEAGGRRAVDVGELTSYASRHDDAHLVKYTLACLLAARTDPAWSQTYLAAAQHLADWWRVH